MYVCYPVSETGVTWGSAPHNLPLPLPKIYSGVPWTPGVTPDHPDVHNHLESDQTRHYNTKTMKPRPATHVSLLADQILKTKRSKDKKKKKFTG